MTDSRINQRLCDKCGRPYWAWSTGKKLCQQCAPDPPQVAAATLRLVREGKGL